MEFGLCKNHTQLKLVVQVTRRCESVGSKAETDGRQKVIRRINEVLTKVEHECRVLKKATISLPPTGGGGGGEEVCGCKVGKSV